MNAKTAFEAAKEITGMTQLEIAKLTGIPVQSVGQKINVRQTVKMNEFIKVMDVMGVGIFFLNKEKGIVLLRSDYEPDKIKGIGNALPIIYDKNDDNQVWEIMSHIITCEGVRFSILEKSIGYYVQELEYKTMRRGSIKADEFLKVASDLGYEPHFYLKESGGSLLSVKERKGRERVRGMSDRVVYDTDEAELLASSFYADGEHEFGVDGKAQELYVDRENRYFIAEYSNDGEKARIRSVPAHMATAFINQYGIAERSEDN